QAALELRRLPVEEAPLVGTGDHAVAAADATIPDLHHDALGVLIGRAYRADFYAGRVLAVLAGIGQHVRLRQLVFGLLPQHRHPLDAPGLVLLARALGGNVVLLAAG